MTNNITAFKIWPFNFYWIFQASWTISGHPPRVSNNQGTCGQIGGWMVDSAKCVGWRLTRLVLRASPRLNEHLRVSAIIALTCVRFSEVFLNGVAFWCNGNSLIISNTPTKHTNIRGLIWYSPTYGYRYTTSRAIHTAPWEFKYRSRQILHLGSQYFCKKEM